jgi:FkbM family methyltransferase
MYSSQWKQDKWLNENIFRNKRGGVFIDIGAHDGVCINNTLFYERNLGWTGICIEPIPSVFEELKKNRQAECIHGCAFNRDGTVLFRNLNGYTEQLSGIAETYNVKHLDRIDSELSIYGGDAQYITVNCYKLETLLEQRGITHVDYLSVDTEGSELQILKGINFDKVCIDVIETEVNYPEDEVKITEFLISKGYKYKKKLGGDVVFVRL